jgi:hypothetical protein
LAKNTSKSLGVRNKFMQFALEVAILEFSFPQHSQEIIQIKFGRVNSANTNILQNLISTI